jgi:tetratricopeptide (TPR) repeat protein
MKRLIILIVGVLFSVLPIWAQAQDIENLYELGITTYWDYGTEAEAIEIFSQVIALDPNFIDAYAYRGATYRLIDEMEFAKADFDYALQRDPQNGLALSMLARWHMERGESTLALETSRQALALEPDIAVIHYNHARILTAIGDYEDGLGAYDEAIRLEKNAAALSQYYYNRGVNISRHMEIV